LNLLSVNLDEDVYERIGCAVRAVARGYVESFERSKGVAKKTKA
jgi:hypothetical protein